MLDARNIADQNSIDTDICIIGAGAAGISLALGLAGTSIRVCIIESGGLTFERGAQNLYAGINAGLEYEPLDLCRVRGFGGSTGPKGWGGWCKPLSEIDFATRPWVALSGWPFDVDTLRPYYARAGATLGFSDDAIWSRRGGPSDGMLPLSVSRLENELCPLSPAPDLGESCLAKLQAAQNVRILLHANVIEIATDCGAAQATGVHIATLSGHRLFVGARYVILATGGLENARLLLMSNRIQGEGLGNGSDFVGRCFMEHPRFAWGCLEGRHLADQLWRYDPGIVVRQRRSVSGDLSARPIFGAGLALKPDVQGDEKLLNARSWIVPVAGNGESEGGQELKELVFWLKKKRLPSDLSKRILRIVKDFGNAGEVIAAHFLEKMRPAKCYQFITVMEQAPDRGSRVTLDTSRDALGQNRLRLDWRVGALEEHTLERNRALIVEGLSAIGVKCSFDHPKRSVVGPQPKLQPKWVWHHMGTTRMSCHPRTGVVDADCRVHGTHNLYVAGSSIFPTGGNDMPTLTVVALAYRLADHLKARIARDDQPIEPVSAASSRARSVANA